MPTPEINLGSPNVEPAEPLDLMSQLSASPLLGERIQALEASAFLAETSEADLDEQHTTGLPTGINTEATLRSHINFIDGYSWSIDLAVMRYQQHHDVAAVNASAVEAFFSAIDSHNQNKHPDFLLYLSDILDSHLKTAHGEPTEPDIPSASAFDSFVTENYLPSMPKKPEERTPDDFSIGDKVLVIIDGELVNGKVSKISNREGLSPYILRSLPEDAIPAIRERLYAKGQTFTLRDEAAGSDETAEIEEIFNERLAGPISDEEVRARHALGRLPMRAYVKNPQFRRNPDLRPSTVSVAISRSEQISARITSAELINEKTWEKLVDNKAFLDAYLQIYSGGIPELRKFLETAILNRMDEGFSGKPSGGRARFHTPITHRVTTVLGEAPVNTPVTSGGKDPFTDDPETMDEPAEWEQTVDPLAESIPEERQPSRARNRTTPFQRLRQTTGGPAGKVRPSGYGP